MNAILRTEICDLLGIECPVCQAGMGGISGPALTAAVSNAGGLGTLGAFGCLDAAQVRDWIQRTRALTDKVFAVDFGLPSGLPKGMEELHSLLSPEYVESVNRLRAKLGLGRFPSGNTIWGSLTQDMVQEMIQVILDEKVPIFVSALGDPSEIVGDAHAQGMKVMALAGNVRQARRMKEGGVDVIVAQGHEAGGHTGRIGTMALVPQIVDAIHPTPVLAAGGIADGRGLVAALALGAVGAWVGTAFVATHEACLEAPETGQMTVPAIDLYKQKILQATDEGTEVTRVFTGKTSRLFRCELTKLWEKECPPPLPMPMQAILSLDTNLALMEAGMTDYWTWSGGQIAGAINQIRSAREVLDTMIEGATNILADRLGIKQVVKG